MNTRNILAIGAGLAILPVFAQAQERDPLDKNRFSVGARLHFNVTADLSNLPAGAAAGPIFDDGFVLDDISGSAGGKTWNWGYSSNDQTPAGTDTLLLHGMNSPRDGTTERLSRDPQYGFEIGYGRELARFGSEKSPMIFGVETSFGSSALSVTANRSITGPATRTEYSFPLGGIVPPGAPYAGTFEGPIPPAPPMPLIGTTGTAGAPTTVTATSSQRADIDGTYFGFRVGPFIETPMLGRFSLQFGGGVAAVHADAKLSYTETFTAPPPGGPPAPRTNTQSSDDWLLGFYGEAKIQYWINDATAIYLGGQYQALEDFKLRALNKEATLNFGDSIGVVAGVTFAF